MNIERESPTCPYFEGKRDGCGRGLPVVPSYERMVCLQSPAKCPVCRNAEGQGRASTAVEGSRNLHEAVTVL
jgi:hypothetical protein